MTQIQQRLKHLRMRARNALWLHGVSWLVVTFLGAALAVGTLDWLIHVDQPVMRMALSSVTVVAVATLAWRVLIRPLRITLSDVALAMKIERRFPGFQDSLASTVAFSQESPDAAIGSAELRSKVIRETESRLRSVNVNDVIETRDVRLISWIAVGMCALVAFVAGVRPGEASLVVERFVFPFSAPEWPRKTHLQLLDADLKPLAAGVHKSIRRVEGETFKFYVENTSGSLPKDVQLIVRHGDGRQEIETLRRVSVRDSNDSVRNVCVANILVDRGPIRFRVVGGDDDVMPTRTIEAVPAPRLKTFHVELTPPAYTRRPVQKLPPGIGHFEALVGTEVTVTALANSELQSARLRVKNQTFPPLKLSRDGKRFTAKFRIRESGNYAYSFAMTDRKGFGNPNAPRYDIRANADRVPVVRLRSPARNFTATRNARIKLEYSVEDDLGIRGVSLVTRNGNNPGRNITVLVAPPSVEDAKVNQQADLRELKRTYRWTLPGPPVGSRVSFFVEADDYFQLDSQGRPDKTGKVRHVGRSVTRTITIVSASEKTAEIARKYGELLEDLQRAEKDQSETHAHVAQLRIQLQKTGALKRQADLVLLKRIAREQFRLGQDLAGERSGIQHRAAMLRQQMRDNHLDNSALARRLERIDGELAAIKRSALRDLQQDLRQLETTIDTATKAKQPKTSTQQRETLKSIAANQQAALRSLRDLVAELSEWRNWHDLTTELKQLIKTQQTIQADVARQNKTTQGKLPADLTDQQKADLARLGERQRRIGKRLERFGESVDRFLTALKRTPDGNRAAIDTLTEAAGLQRNKPFERNLQRMATDIESNRLNRTGETGKTVLADLDELLAALENRPTEDLETLVKKQRQAERELETLQKQQREIADKLETLIKRNDPKRDRDELLQLIKKQQQLKKKAGDLARRLRRLSADAATQAMQRAEENMEQGLEFLRKNDPRRGQVDVRESLDNLQQARRELARQRLRNENRLAREQMEKFALEVKGLLARQQNVIRETERLKKEHAASGRWTPARLRTLDSLQAEQESLRKRIHDRAKATKSAAVFSLALERIAGSMQSAAKTLGSILESRKAKELPTAIQHEQQAERQLKELLASLIPERAPAGKAGPPQTGDGDPAAGAELGGPSAMSQLKLLRQLQSQLTERTAAFNKTVGTDDKRTPAQKQVERQLANEQQRLSDLTRALMRDLGIRDPGSEAKPATDPKKSSPAQLFRRAWTGMSDASKRIAQSRTGKTTGQLQQAAIDSLDRLIKTARRVQAESNDGNAGSKKRPNNKAGTKQNSSSKTGSGKKSGDPKKKNNDSDPGVRKSPAQLQKQRAARRDRLIQEVWGHLPEHVKQQLRNVAGEKYLPKYKPLINKYFESLAK